MSHLSNSVYLEDCVLIKFWYLDATVDSPLIKKLDFRRTTIKRYVLCDVFRVTSVERLN
jgi:hypothetical protein